MPRCQKGTRRNRKTKMCEPTVRKSPKTPKSTTLKNKNVQKLSLGEINDIIENTNNSKNEDYIKSQLSNLKFDKKYVHPFTGKKSDVKTLYDQGYAKVQAWNKYKDPIV